MSNGQAFPPLWLAWVGERTLPLETVWFKYLRRFGVDHWYKFAKQRLHWTLPNLRTPEQSERWSDLMPLMSWQLWLAKDLVVENLLPWQSATSNLTPGRVAQSMLSVLVDIGTPAKMPCAEGKIPWLGKRKDTYQGTVLSHCEKTGFSTQKVFKISYLIFFLLSF